MFLVLVLKKSRYRLGHGVIHILFTAHQPVIIFMCFFFLTLHKFLFELKFYMQVGDCNIIPPFAIFHALV